MAKQQFKQTPFEGRSAKMKKESPWLASEDLMGIGDVKLIIEGVFYNEDVPTDSGRKDNFYSIKFQKTPKQMVINSTNRQRIVDWYGPEVVDWKGKELTLYVDMDVKQVGGGKGPGLRVRPIQKKNQGTANLER